MSAVHGFQNISELPPPVSPPRPKYQSYRSFNDTSRAQPPTSRPQHHHHYHLHHRQKDSRDKIKDGQSHLTNTQGGRNVWAGSASRIEASKSAGATPEESLGPSRRASIMGKSDELGSSDDAPMEVQKVVKEGELEAETAKGVLRATELRNTLSNLNTLSNNTTRRLDMTYYSILEKMTMLQNTLSSMKELAMATKQLNQEFMQDSEDVVAEIEISLDTFKGFEKHQTRIEELAARVAVGRNKIDGYNDRVDIIRDKVIKWEESDVEWQERTRQRLRILWMCIAVVAVLITGLMVFQMTPARTQGPGLIKGWNASLIGGTEPGTDDPLKSSFSLTRHDKPEKKQEEEEEVLEDEPRLRVFDEL